MERQIEEMDKISDLPDFILHRILSFLPKKEAGRTSVLSKRWSSIWDSFPIFDFYQTLYLKGDRSTPEYKEKLRGFMNFVDKSLQKFSGKKLGMERLLLSICPVDHNLVSMIDRWLLLALNNGVQEMTLNVSTDLMGGSSDFYYVLPKSLFAVKPLNGSSIFNRLQNLSLRWVQISESVIQDINHNCPNINYFFLEHFCGLRTIKISKLHKLETVIIVDALPKGLIDSVSIDAPKLKYFRFDPYNHAKLPSKISLTSCHDLKELSLRNCGVTDDWLQLCLSRFPFLEKLEIMLNPALRRVKISRQQLKTLSLNGCNNIESIQIDAPSLSLFKLKTYIIPDLVLENVTCRIEFEYLSTAKYGTVDSFRFLKLRKFLGDLPQIKYFRLYGYRNEVFCFDLEEFGQVTIPPPITIDYVKLTSYGIEESVDCATLIDGLLWSCHPMTISVPTDSAFQNNCIKVLCEKLLDKEHPTCCNSSRIKCWRHDLKAAKIERFGDIEDEQQLLHPNLLLDKLPSLTRYHEIRINLEWSFERWEMA